MFEKKQNFKLTLLILIFRGVKIILFSIDQDFKDYKRSKVKFY